VEPLAGFRLGETLLIVLATFFVPLASFATTRLPLETPNTREAEASKDPNSRLTAVKDDDKEEAAPARVSKAIAIRSPVQQSTRRAETREKTSEGADKRRKHKCKGKQSKCAKEPRGSERTGRYKQSVGRWVGTKESVGTRGRFLEQSAVVCGHWLLQSLGD